MSKGSNSTRTGSASTTRSATTAGGWGNRVTATTSRSRTRQIEAANKTIDDFQLSQWAGVEKSFKIGNVTFKVSRNSRQSGNGSINAVNVRASSPGGVNEYGEFRYGLQYRDRTAQDALERMKETLRNRMDYILSRK